MAQLENTIIRVAGFEEESIVDGPGIRSVLFVQGCSNHCKGCQNPQTWDFEGGIDVSADKILDRILQNKLIHGVTFSGGEPFDQAEKLLPLAEALKERGYSLVAFSGYTFETLIQAEKNIALIKLLDLLIDGPFIEEEKSLDLRFRGSKNQRIINIKATIQNNWNVVLDKLHEPVSR